MTVSVKLDELYLACEMVSAGMDAEAYISRTTGVIHVRADGIDEELPDDVDDDSLYLAVPDKSEFDLGRSLAVAFVDKHLPDSSETVRDHFRKRGAYRRFKAMLDDANQLDAWYRFEEAAREAALSEWCEENGLTATRG